MKVASKLMLKYWNRAPLGQTVKNFFTHPTNGAVPIDECTNAAHALIFRYIDWAVYEDTTVKYNPSNNSP